ncbi:MAG: murein biosynthesis integral membrane protein MurJ, partial [Planctomycetales bacterium]
MRSQFLQAFRLTSLGTLASRVLGMLRDVVTGALLGLDQGGVMDAFSLAFRIPDFFRRLFGEGTLAAGYLPILTARLEEDRDAAWKLVSALFADLAVGLSALVVVGWAICWALLQWDDSPQAELLLGLTAGLLPYVVLVCLAAQVAATLHALGRFAAPALAPACLNVCWLIAACWAAPAVSENKATQAGVLVVAVLLGGLCQLGIQVPVLFACGFRLDWDWAKSRDDARRVLLATGPAALGLAVTQINTLADSLMAWALSAPSLGSSGIAWLGGVEAPLREGAAAAVYFSERLFQFPVGVLGVAVGAAVFPLLSRHAARGDAVKLGADLTLGLRMVLVAGIPAAAGLVALAHPISETIFQHGEFTAEAAARTSRMIACYGCGVWAYCAAPVLVRGFYAMGDFTTPLRIGATIVVLNVFLNCVLARPFAEQGLAASTMIAASLQVVALAALLSRKKAALEWGRLYQVAWKSTLAAAVMAAALCVALSWFPPGGSFPQRLSRLLIPMTLG